jgi:hypothetical protein
VELRKFSLRLEPAASEVKGKCANHLATEAPKYVNKKTKMVWFERYQEKCFLASGFCTKATADPSQKKFFYNMVFSVSRDEMLELCEALGKARRDMPANYFNYFELSRTKDWTGKTVCLVLRDDDEFGGMKLLRLKSVDDEMEVDGGSDSDLPQNPRTKERS